MGKIKETIERLKNMLDKDKNNKWGENLVILIIIGMIIIIAGGTLFGGNDKKKMKTKSKAVKLWTIPGSFEYRC